MSRRFNYTGRKRLTKDCIRINLHDGGPGKVQSFSARLQIPADLDLEPHARVYVEAYVGSSSMRFDFGTVAAPSVPAQCNLWDIDSGAPILFRIKVVGESANVGRLLASARGIRPEGDKEGNGRKALLPLRGINLDEEIWRLDVDSDAGPTLSVNNRIPGIVERLPMDAVLAGAIYPEVVRQMTRLLWSHESRFDEGEEWVLDWKKWLMDQLGRKVTAEDLDSADALDLLGDDVASTFSSKQKLASAIIALHRGTSPHD